MRRSTWIFGFIAIGALVVAAIVSPSPSSGPVPPGTTGPVPGPGMNDPMMSSSSAGHVHLRTGLETSSILLGGGGVSWLAVTLSSDEVEAAARPPLNVAIVIDASGSMSGKPLEHAKTAAREMVSRLGTADRVSLVAYGSYAEVLVAPVIASGSGKERLHLAIDSISDMGGTNIHDGLAFARSELKEHASKDRLNRIVLLSDGQANAGAFTTARDLGRFTRTIWDEGISVSAMGLGLDYDEDVMMAVAEHGGGNYYFIESPASLLSIFERELGSFSALVATATVVDVIPAAGVEIIDVVGYATERSGGAVVIRPGDLYGGVERKIVMQLRVPDGTLGGLPIADVRLRFEDATAAGAARTASASVAAMVVADAGLVEGSRSKDVTAKVVEVEVARDMEEATAAFERGDRVGALRALATGKGRLAASVSAGYVSPSAAAPAAEAVEELITIGGEDDAEADKRFKKKAKGEARAFAE